MTEKELFEKYPPKYAINILEDMSEDYGIPITVLKDVYDTYKSFLRAKVNKKDTINVPFYPMGNFVYLLDKKSHLSRDPVEVYEHKKALIKNELFGVPPKRHANNHPPKYTNYVVKKKDKNGKYYTIKAHAQEQNEYFIENNPNVETTKAHTDGYGGQNDETRHKILLGEKKADFVLRLPEKLHKQEETKSKGKGNVPSKSK